MRVWQGSRKCGWEILFKLILKNKISRTLKSTWTYIPFEMSLNTFRMVFPVWDYWSSEWNTGFWVRETEFESWLCNFLSRKQCPLVISKHANLWMVLRVQEQLLEAQRPATKLWELTSLFIQQICIECLLRVSAVWILDAQCLARLTQSSWTLQKRKKPNQMITQMNNNTLCEAP